MLNLKTFARIIIPSLLLLSPAFAAEKSTALQLIELAKSNSPVLRDAITTTFDAKDLKEGTAWIADGPNFSSPQKPPRSQHSSSTEFPVSSKRCKHSPTQISGISRQTSNQ